MMRHRNAWAEERISPTVAQWQAEMAEEENVQDAEKAQGGRTMGVRKTETNRSELVSRSVDDILGARRRVRGRSDPNLPHDTLVVASKLKAYVRAKSGMNTSSSVLETLSDRLRELCDDAIDVAESEGRKTIMDRDFK